MSGRIWINVLAILLPGFFLLISPAANAQQAHWRLLMFDADDCAFCERWHREVGVIYDKTPEGTLAPLEVTNLGDALPPGVRLAESVRYTPTFVMLNSQGNEIGRITGYISEEQFWGLLETLLPPAEKG